ncbi:MAG: nucleotidyltransferase domain-containing protein [archaeon]
MVNLFKLIQILGKNTGNEMPMRQLSIEAKVPYTTTIRLINANKSLFVINPKGNIKLVSLNLDDSITKNYLILAERQEAEGFLKKEAMFRLFKGDLPKGEYALILFGSRADGTHREKSDVDLCIINKKGEKNLRFSKLELINNVEVNPMYFADKEFEAMLRDKEHNVGKEIVKKHIVLYGEEYFWNLVWNNGIR